MSTNPIRDAIAAHLSTVTTVADVRQWDRATDTWSSTAWAHHPTLSEAESAASVVLGTRVPSACPDCHGSGHTFDLICDNCGGSASLPLEMTCSNHLAKPLPCTHPNAPTISKLIAIGEAVMLNNFTVKAMDSDDLNHLSPFDAFWSGSDSCWAALRAVEAQP